MQNTTLNPTRPYHRTEIDILFTKVKAQMHQKALREEEMEEHFIKTVTQGKSYVAVIATTMNTFVLQKLFLWSIVTA